MSSTPTTDGEKESRATVADTTATPESSREDRVRGYIKESTPGDGGGGGGSDPAIADSITPDFSQLPGLWSDWASLQKLRTRTHGSKGLNDDDLGRIVAQVEDDEILPVGSTEKIKDAARFRVVMVLRERGTQSGDELKKVASEAASEALSKIKAGR
ncbi:hypothetical protein JCM24511_00660 [Saitozyma sp. JCM 24511]|nr:hypothetical protein JCM24511_00660 [Saitozyma sp. JCM 24511]